MDLQSDALPPELSDHAYIHTYIHTYIYDLLAVGRVLAQSTFPTETNTKLIDILMSLVQLPLMVAGNIHR